MSDPAQTPPTLRLLEPRALQAADQLGARLERAPLVRALTRRALGFADRLFHYWIGRTVERFPSRAAARGPSSATLSFPRPWFDPPPAWPVRGITLRAP